MKSKMIGFQNEVIKNYIETKKGKGKKDLFVVEGIWAYEKLIATQTPVEIVIYCPSLVKNTLQMRILNHLIDVCHESYEVSEKTLRRIYEKSELGCMVAICRKKSMNHRFKKVVVLDGIENPGNLGTIFRSCDGAGFDGVFIVNEKTKVNQYKVIKASMGGCFNVPWIHFDSIKQLKMYLSEHNFRIYLAHPTDENAPVEKDKPVCLVLGNERFGLSKEWFQDKHQIISLPMNGCCDSLNVGVAASILIYKSIEY